MCQTILYIYIIIYYIYMSKKEKTLLVIELDSNVHKSFKGLCNEKDTAMTPVVRRCIKTWMDKQNQNVVY